MRTSERQQDFVQWQPLVARRQQRARQQRICGIDIAGSEFLFRDAQQRSGVVGHRRENLLVDRARLGASSAGFVLRRKREGVLDGRLHVVARGRARRQAADFSSSRRSWA